MLASWSEASRGAGTITCHPAWWTSSKSADPRCSIHEPPAVTASLDSATSIIPAWSTSGPGAADWKEFFDEGDGGIHVVVGLDDQQVAALESPERGLDGLHRVGVLVGFAD